MPIEAFCNCPTDMKITQKNYYETAYKIDSEL